MQKDPIYLYYIYKEINKFYLTTVIIFSCFFTEMEIIVWGLYHMHTLVTNIYLQVLL